MRTYKVELTYGTFYVTAEYYSLIKGTYQFWEGKRIKVSYPEAEVVDITDITVERPV